MIFLLLLLFVCCALFACYFGCFLFLVIFVGFKSRLVTRALVKFRFVSQFVCTNNGELGTQEEISMYATKSHLLSNASITWPIQMKY